MSFDYRLKNGDGKYIMEYIPDTKPLKGKKMYLSRAEDKNPSIDGKSGKVQYDVVFELNQGAIPKLKDAVIEIESVNIFYENEEIKKFDGIWNLPIENNTKEEEKVKFEYEAVKASPHLELISAKVNPTSLNIAFSIDKIIEDENEFIDMKVVDNKGTEYTSSGGYRTDVKDGKMIIYTNFPISSYDEMESVTLKTRNFGEIKLKKK
ncbi:TPA: hypothetical protein ROX98_000341 [Bacillus pseudomycoides]|nr:hypothetical protein [Bacillus pseudomycoides]